MKKITVFSVSKTDNMVDLEQKAKEMNLDLEIVNLESFEQAENNISNYGNVIFWRSSKLALYDERTAFLKLLSNKSIVNKSLLTNITIASKLYQQKIVSKKTSIPYIITFKVATLDELKQLISDQKLKYPFITKPKVGAKGNGVDLIKSEEELSKVTDELLANNIFQNFIENDGDYRVFMVGGKAIGIMKRIAKEGSFLNNISQGGTGEAVTNSNKIDKLAKIGEEVAAAFDLNICGVDVIFNKQTKEYTFLEVNTVPQWQGLVEATQIDVAGIILEYFNRLADREGNKSTFELVKETYENCQNNLKFKQKFHFNSRMYWWTKDQKYLVNLEEFKNEYIGSSDEEIAQSIKDIANTRYHYHGKIDSREKYHAKYPSLKTYTTLLTRNIFVSTIYKKDISNLIIENSNIQEMDELYNNLSKDPAALVGLSTNAINFIYFYKFFKNQTDKNFEFNPQFLFNALNENSNETLRNKIYFSTHIVIGASEFYNKLVEDDKEIYTNILKVSENLIEDNFFEISLDMKLEFIVCSRLLNYQSRLEKVIMSEAKNSLSDLDNYLVDKFNTHSSTNTKNSSFSTSEHRSVLYLLCNLPFINSL